MTLLVLVLAWRKAGLTSQCCVDCMHLRSQATEQTCYFDSWAVVRVSKQYLCLLPSCVLGCLLLVQSINRNVQKGAHLGLTPPIAMH